MTEEEIKTEEPEVLEKPEFEKKLEEMRAENDRMEKNIQEMKELKAIDALSGKADVNPESKPEEIDSVEYAKGALQGKILK